VITFWLAAVEMAYSVSDDDAPLVGTVTVEPAATEIPCVAPDVVTLLPPMKIAAVFADGAWTKQPPLSGATPPIVAIATAVVPTLVRFCLKGHFISLS
jgi:hypothetical protein